MDWLRSKKEKGILSKKESEEDSSLKKPRFIRAIVRTIDFMNYQWNYDLTTVKAIKMSKTIFKYQSIKCK